MGNGQNAGKRTGGGKGFFKLCFVSLLLLGAALAYLGWLEHTKARSSSQMRLLLTPIEKDTNYTFSKAKILPYAKPVIYLYPEVETEVTVRLEYTGRLTCTYPQPDPDGAWRVTAKPDGTLTDSQGWEYSYLFWEGESDGTPPDFSRGFVVKGSDTAAFLREKLAYMGLTPREYNEFIVY